MHRRDVLAPAPEIIAQAADWLVRMDAGKLDITAEVQLQAWRSQNSEHERAWQAAMQLKTMMGNLPAELSQPVLTRARMDRRQLLLSIGVLAAALPIVWATHEQLPALTADHRTAKGEQRSITLADGSQLQLNTASAVDVHFDQQQRLIRLYQGEIHIVTAPDNAPAKRPFIVWTPTGNICALGTRFSVRTLGNNLTQVNVYEHAVAITPNGSTEETRIDAGQQAFFDRKKLHLISAQNQSAPGWTRGQLIADNQRLDDFIAELARYHLGVLRCDPAVADLRISGVFQLKNTQQILVTVADTLRIRVSRHTDYWITLTLP